jgi:ribonuclease HII
VERDTYIGLLCQEHNDLNEKYGISNNKGYGTKQHLEGIKKHGISKWHRKTYGICREYC